MVSVFLQLNYNGREEAPAPRILRHAHSILEAQSILQESISAAGNPAPMPIREDDAFEFESEATPVRSRTRNSSLRHIEEELQALDLEESTKENKGRYCPSLREMCRSSQNAPRSCIDTPYANGFFGGVIMLNAIFIGIESDHRIRSDGNWVAWYLVDNLFLSIFISELLLRFWSLGCRSALRDHWNIFDLTIVTFGALDSWVLHFAVSDSEGQVLGLLRLVRLLRVLRIVRLFRFFRELQLLANGILGALRAMVWAALLIILALYLSAVLATNLIGKSDGVKRDDEIGVWFGTILSSVFTLFQLMTLEDWPDILRRVMAEEPLAWMFFVPFMMFMNFAMLNVITAVVVEKVFNIAQSEAVEEARREERKRTGTLRKIKQLFDVIDKDGNMLLELDEFREALETPAVVQQFMELGIAKYDADDLFACLDLDGDCRLSTAEFVEGCIRVHGPAQSKHLLQVQYDILRNWDELRMDLEELTRHVRWVIRHLAYRKKWWGAGHPKLDSAPGNVRPSKVFSSARRETKLLVAQLLGSSSDSPRAARASVVPVEQVPTTNNEVSDPAAGHADGQAAGGAWSLAEAEAKAAVEELRGIREEQRALRSTVEGLITDVRCIREDLPEDIAAQGDDEAG